ncbi:MAG: hypothetical protein ABEJ58_00280 [Halodesulfurarchaeum sp.]
MGHEAYVQLTCPECRKAWEANPSELPSPDGTFTCPSCETNRRMAEFMRTDRDLQTLKRLQ